MLTMCRHTLRLPACALVAAIFMSTLAAAQRAAIPNDTLATYGASAITARDFLERIELMPFPGKDRRSEHDSAKVHALRSLVAEKLLAQEAASRRVHRDSASLRRRSGLERLMVRDELYKREVVAKVEVNDRERSMGMRRLPKELHLLFIYASSAKQAEELHDSLVAERSFEDALNHLSARLLRRADSVVVTFGVDDQTLEDSAYALSMSRRFSFPLKSEYFGWGVLYLVAQRPNEAANKSVPDRISTVESIVRQRKMVRRAAQYQGEILSPQRAVVDSVTFLEIAHFLHSQLTADSSGRKGQSGYRLNQSDINALEAAFTSKLDNEFVHIPSGGMTLIDVLDAIRSFEFAFPQLDTEDFTGRLNAALKTAVTSELMSREGYRRNLQHTEAVRHDVAVWDDYWTAAALIKSVRDSVAVSESEVMNFLVKNGSLLGALYEVNVREVLCDSLGRAYDVLSRAVNGEPLGQLAREFSRRTKWAEQDGVSGFFRVSTNPALGFPALLQDSGSIGGPLKLKEGFSIFTTLEKRTSRPDGALHLDSLKYFSREGALMQKQKQAVDSLVGALARSAGVRIYTNRLSRIQVSMPNMFTRRFIGFGGTVTAVPTIMQLWNWGEGDRERVMP
jgi:hypothetical protein